MELLLCKWEAGKEVAILVKILTIYHRLKTVHVVFNAHTQSIDYSITLSETRSQGSLIY